MKTLPVLFFIISLYAFQDAVSTQDIMEKARRIRMELLNSKSLPANFLKSNDVSSASFMRSFFYFTTRKENNITVDSVLMIVTIYIEDSLEHILSFNETLTQNGKEKTYMYKVNKYGVIDWAYRAEGESKPTYDETGKITGATMPPQTIEINSDSVNYKYDPVHYPIKNPDEKTMAFYNAKLVTSLDELDKMLFAK